MPLNPLFQFHAQELEQNLYEDLIIESIQMYGYDFTYIPRTINDYNPILNEDAGSSYDSATVIEMYIKNSDGYQPDNMFLSRFNIEVRSEITLTVSKKRFAELIGTPQNITRPHEGDLIWFELDQKIFMIKKVDTYSFAFYQTGRLHCWELVCEVFEYAGENLNTGISEIDSIQHSLSTDVDLRALVDQNDVEIVDQDGETIDDTNLDRQTDDLWSDNKEIDEEGEEFIDFTEDNPFSENF